MAESLPFLSDMHDGTCHHRHSLCIVLPLEVQYSTVDQIVMICLFFALLANLSVLLFVCTYGSEP